MEIVFIVGIGLIIGSFLNVCIYRIAREESIVFPHSHCTSCGYKLKMLDLVPVFSYTFLRGRCRNCKEKISIKYPLVESLNSILYLILYLNFGFSLNFFKFSLFISLLIVIGFIDLETKYVFDSSVNFGIISSIIFLTFQFVSTKIIPWDNIIGGIIGFFIIWVIVVLTNGMGKGDIYISLICGLFLGVKGICVTLFLSFILGGVVAIISLSLKIKERGAEIAFGPYFAIGGIIATLWGYNLIDIYLKVFL